MDMFGRMQLTLDDTQAGLLRELLDSALRDLRMEIVTTDNPTWKRTLHEREDAIRSMLEPLGGPLH